MLKITMEPSGDEFRLKLEGSVAGPWVQDLEECWREVAAAPGGRSTCLDLTDVGHVDDAGRYLLALIARAGTRLVSDGVATKGLLESLERDWPAAPTTTSPTNSSRPAKPRAGSTSNRS